MNLQDVPVGTQVTIIHRFLVAEIGYSCWETEEITGVVCKHPNESTTLIRSGAEFIFCRNDKDRVI